MGRDTQLFNLKLYNINYTISADNLSYAGTIVPTRPQSYFIPLRFRALKVYARQTAATHEHKRADARNAIRYSYTREITAMAERIIAYNSNTVRNRYTGQTVATTERITIDDRYAIGNSYALEISTVGERIRSDASDLIANRYTCKACAIMERRIANACYAIWNGYTCYIRTKCECIRGNVP